MQNQARHTLPPDEAAAPPTSAQQKRAVDELFSLVYEELRRLASFVRRNDFNATINSTALVHEAWLKMKDSPHLAANEASHFKAIAAKAMRQVLVDEARRKHARKRGGSGEAILVALGDSPEELSVTTSVFSSPSAPQNAPQTISSGDQLLQLDALLEELARLSPRQAQIVENRFFGGLNVAETAAVLGLSESSVERDWRSSKAWLASKMSPARDPASGRNPRS